MQLSQVDKRLAAVVAEDVVVELAAAAGSDSSDYDLVAAAIAVEVVSVACNVVALVVVGGECSVD